MLTISALKLFHFKNYTTYQCSFNTPIVAICGANGSGKTNLLDAIYYLCFTKSYFLKQDNLIVKHNTAGMRVEGFFLKNETTLNAVGILRENNKKEFLLNDEAYKKLSHHIGKLPCVMIAPDDVEIISGTSEERRKFMDAVLSQLNNNYLQWLIDYNKILQQRNSFLKHASTQTYFDETLLATLDHQLSIHAALIYEERKLFFQTFTSTVIKLYHSIAGKNENIEITYESQLLNNSLQHLLTENRQKDLYLQRTGFGIHKDDINITINNQSFKLIASQGQRKSLLFALKLAEFETLKQHKGFSPILLLDDIFEKLDAERMHYLLQKVCVENNCQVFITDTHKQRLEQHLNNLQVKFQLIEL
ncbi:MAG: DNA replication and repair protein RecF [Bacteroidetes bacterium]|nr:DNA replication and repair protein RecF [Bacteroidota bacterium]MBS1650155.1 DNA replication and repair protein RecF [Bacteroidota bacterium]